MAGSVARFAVPARGRRCSKYWLLMPSSVATPTSMTMTDAPTCLARTLIAAPPATNVLTI
jgi:hypothetical protein